MCLSYVEYFLCNTCEYVISTDYRRRKKNYISKQIERV